jgi:pimeloyl-ACP methyl ester carboxylesterase
MNPPSQNCKGIPLHFRVAGPPGAPPLLLLHGITGSTRYWARAEGDLDRRHRLLIPDLPGFGNSPKPDRDYDISLFVSALRGFLEGQGLTQGPIDVIGHSLGGIVALEYLALHPGAFGRMTLLSLPRHVSREEAHRLFLANSVNYRRILGVNDLRACFSSFRETGPEVFFKYLTRFPTAVVRDSTKFTLRSLLTTLEYCLLDYRLDEVLERVPAVPTLLLHGSEDKVAPLENVAHLAGRQGWTLRVVRGTGHHLFLTHPLECLREIHSFLDGERGSRPADRPGAPMVQGA